MSPDSFVLCEVFASFPGVWTVFWRSRFVKMLLFTPNDATVRVLV